VEEGGCEDRRQDPYYHGKKNAERDLLYVPPTNPDLLEATWNTAFRGLGCG